MEKKLLKSILLIITYTVVLVLCLVKIDALLGLLGKLLGLLQPVYIGFALAFVLNRPCEFFYRLYDRGLGRSKAAKLSRPLAVVSAYMLLLLVIAAIFSFVLPKLVESIQLFANSLGGYIYNLQRWGNELLGYLNLEMWDTIDLSGLSSYLQELLNKTLQTLGNTLTHVMEITSAVISVVVTLVLAVVFSIYMLAGRETLLGQSRRVLVAYAPKRISTVILEVVELTAKTFTNFVTGQLTEACILGGLCALGMLFIQADYAPLVGVIVGVSALIPVAGAYMGAILGAFVLVMVSPVKALIFLVFLGILQQIEGNAIYPRVVGTSIGLPGIWVLAAVTVGGGLFDLPGILLSVPVASVVYTLLKQDVRRRLAEPEEER
ncbi:AI-2E family transporter [Pseudoflavonifractor sp. 524-17]|uniref:AI-2E family transporter n=1 Tax=Pseudoflavonifractor sp. 524-17 TaxID=2304577 RepID=UPI00137AB89A|nr:AI-2E family transporter [Pseudoflavonifractor sp. 524-17]NCE65630.1 AI-2E family transporter [Pseudoflavonifractor sp. 524-17]